MSSLDFFSDLFEGTSSHLGTDLEHAPSSLEKHPSELYETLGGAGALAHRRAGAWRAWRASGAGA